MNIAEAMQALLDGKKVRPKHWNEEYFIYKKKGLIDLFFKSDEDRIDDDEFIGQAEIHDDWEIYEEPMEELKLDVGKSYRSKDDEWIYPCVISCIENPEILYIAISDAETNDIAFIKRKDDGEKQRYVIKSEFKVIADEFLRNFS